MGITIITSLLSYYVNAVVEVNIDMGNVTVPESDPMVEICFSLSSGISESIVVTAETAPKDGANQATGTYIVMLQDLVLLGSAPSAT